MYINKIKDLKHDLKTIKPLQVWPKTVYSLVSDKMARNKIALTK